MNGRGARAALLAVTVLGLLVVGGTAPAAGQATDQPRITLSTGVGAPSETVEVIGRGWPAKTVVQVQLCGNLRLNGSVDCLRTNAVTKAADDNGTFAATLVVGVPPTPCPCVVSAATFDGGSPVDAPFEVRGAPTRDPSRTEAAVPTYELRDTHLADDPSLGSRLGLADEREVVATVRNTGTVPLTALPVVATYGTGDAPSRVVDQATVDVAVGASEQVRLTVPVAALSAGSRTVLVTAGDGGRSVGDTLTLSTFPWLLVLLVVVIGVVVVVAVFTRLSRSRRAAPPAEAGAARGYDPAALERDLAERVRTALAGLTPAERSAAPAVIAGRLAPSIAADLAEHYQLDEGSAATLEEGLRDELAARLAQPVGAGGSAR